MKAYKGFMLVEILVVIIIVAILAGLFAASVGNTRESADATRLIESIRTIKSAYIAYYADMHRYPPLTAPEGADEESQLVANLERYAQKPLGDEIRAFGPILIQEGDGVFIGFLGGDNLRGGSEGALIYDELMERAGTFELWGEEGDAFAKGGPILMRVR